MATIIEEDPDVANLWLMDVLNIAFELFPNVTSIDIEENNGAYNVVVVGFKGCPQNVIQHQLIWRNRLAKLNVGEVTLILIPNIRFIGLKDDHKRSNKDHLCN